MPIEVSDYADVEMRAQELGLAKPDGIAFLPRNFDVAQTRDELLHENSVPTVRLLLREAGLNENKIDADGRRIPRAEEKSFSWIAPIIFVTASYLSQSPDAISIALNVISNYLTDFFKGLPGRSPGEQQIKLDVVVESSAEKRYKRISYSGDLAGLKEIMNAVQEVTDDE